MEALSDTERDLLRRSIREFLAARWPADGAVERSAESQTVAAVWRGLADQGLGTLGADAAGAGLREIILAFEELGRAACPAPLLGAVAVNLAFAGQPSNAMGALLEDVQNGKASVALALGAFDGDGAAGRAAAAGDALSGQLAFVESAQFATHLAVFIDGGVAVAASDAAGLTIKATPGLAVPAFSEITFDNTPAIRVNVPAETLADIARIARLACAGRALGAAQRAFEMAVEHAKVRKQFGQLIGQFQAIQHKLANGLISLDGARMTLENAAAARDSGNPDWRTFASAAVAYAGPALRAVAVETHRALGAIGYAEEHEAPRHFRRVHADLARFGGVQRARAELADFLLGPA
ncbi:MAG: acyl-CoA/acyl-ACP dehydrogenase [Xanthobacteraceae bacterium]|nr:acyl-CoA/acyl-ACP dehydrogenase [Xanthobacteraceae bacterium]